MKQSAVLLGLATGLAAASHHDHAHAHNHARRGDDGVVTSWDIKTEWTYVTVTGPPAAGHTPDAAAANPSAPSADAAPSPPAVADKKVNAAAVTPAPASGAASDPIAIQESKNAVQASINAAQQSANNAHQSSMLALQAGGAQPVASASAQPTPVKSVSSAAAPSVATSSSAAAAPPATGGSTSGGWTAIGTFYGGVGYGSCGNVLSNGGHTVAIAENVMTASKPPGGGYPKLCGAKITIVSGGQTWDATVQDSCGACSTDPNGHIDIVQDYAHNIDPNIDVAGHADLTWSFNDASMASMWKQYS